MVKGIYIRMRTAIIGWHSSTCLTFCRGGFFISHQNRDLKLQSGKMLQNIGKHNWPLFIRSLQLKNQVFQIIGKQELWTVPGSC